MLGRGRPHRVTPEVPLWGADLRQKEGNLSAVTWHLEVGKVVTGTVLRAVSEFMIYYKLLHPLRPGVTIPPTKWGGDRRP